MSDDVARFTADVAKYERLSAKRRQEMLSAIESYTIAQQLLTQAHERLERAKERQNG